MRVVAVKIGGRSPGDPPGGAVRLAGLHGGVINLERGVSDAVLATQERLEVGAYRMTVRVRHYQHVRGGGGQTRSDLPDVQVMNLGNVRAGRQRRAHRRRREPGRRRLEEDPPGIPDQPRARVQHQHHHDQRGDRVGPGEPGQQDDQPGYRGGRERVQVRNDVLERARDVQTLLAGRTTSPDPPAPGGSLPSRPRLGDQQRRHHVHGHPDQGDHQYHAAGHGRRRHQPPDRRVAEPGGQQDQGDAVGLRRQDLGALQPVGVPAGRRPGGQPRRDQHQRDGRGVGQHMRGIGDQRERVRRQASYDLSGHEGQDQRERAGQPPHIRAGRRAVRVPVSSRCHLTKSSPTKDRKPTNRTRQHGNAGPASGCSWPAGPRWSGWTPLDLLDPVGPGLDHQPRLPRHRGPEPGCADSGLCRS